MPHKELLEDLIGECPCKNGWCFLREFVLHTGLSDRTLAQARIMLDFRYMLGVWNHREYTDKEAFELYSEKGFDAKFAQVYDANPNISHSDLFYKMFVEQESRPGQ